MEKIIEAISALAVILIAITLVFGEAAADMFLQGVFSFFGMMLYTITSIFSIIT